MKSAIREPLDIVGKPSTSSDQSIDNNQNHSKEFRSELAFNSDGRTVPFDQPLARPRKEISLIEDYSVSLIYDIIVPHIINEFCLIG